MLDRDKSCWCFTVENLDGRITASRSEQKSKIIFLYLLLFDATRPTKGAKRPILLILDLWAWKTWCAADPGPFLVAHDSPDVQSLMKNFIMVTHAFRSEWSDLSCSHFQGCRTSPVNGVNPGTVYFIAVPCAARECIPPCSTHCFLWGLAALPRNCVAKKYIY